MIARAGPAVQVENSVHARMLTSHFDTCRTEHGGHVGPMSDRPESGSTGHEPPRPSAAPWASGAWRTSAPTWCAPTRLATGSGDPLGGRSSGWRRSGCHPRCRACGARGASTVAPLLLASGVHGNGPGRGCVDQHVIDDRGASHVLNLSVSTAEPSILHCFCSTFLSIVDPSEILRRATRHHQARR